MWKGSAVYGCRLFLDSNLDPTPAVCKTIMGRDDAYSSTYMPYGALTCGDEFPFGASIDAHPLSVATRRKRWAYSEDCGADHGGKPYFFFSFLKINNNLTIANILI